MASYKETFVDILDRLTCPHCKDVFNFPVILDCGHSVCCECAEKIGSKNEEGQRCCCCPKCGAESVTNCTYFKVNRTLWESAGVAHVVTACLGKGRSTPEVSNAGDSESGVGDLMSEYSLGSSCSICSVHHPPNMASTRELFEWMFLPTDGLKSEDELSQRSYGFSDCSDMEQRSEDGTSTRGSLSGSGGLSEPELPQQTVLASTRAHIMDLLTGMISFRSRRSLYKTSPYKQVLLDILEPFTCPVCREILTNPVILDCGHNVCKVCAEKISSKNEEGQQYCCCCPKCGAESVTENLHLKVNLTLSKSVNVVREQAVFLWYVLRTPEACSAGDSGRWDIMSTFSVDSSCSIGAMYPPPEMLPKTELFDRMFLVPDGLESEGELSDCTENEQRYKNKAFPRRALSLFVRYFSRSQRDPELSKKKSTRAPSRAPQHRLAHTHDF